MTEVEKKVVEKKVIGRNVAIALGIIVIILVVGLVGAIVNYTSTINDKNNTVATLNSQITTKDNTISSLNSQNSSLTNIVNLENSTIWVDSQTISQSAGSYTSWHFSASYAGYISISATAGAITSTKEFLFPYHTLGNSPTDALMIPVRANVTVQVIYSAYGVNYNNQVNVGTEGTAVFPILPCSNIEIRVGNTITNILSGWNASETVTIIYYY
jgi:hypothetical protein